MDPLAHSNWSKPATVAGFVQSPPNEVLMQFARQQLRRRGGGVVVDIGCGAGRNAVPLARAGWQVLGTDHSWPMLQAAAGRAREEQLDRRLLVVLSPMQHLPVGDRSADLVIAHGIWNLAQSAAEFRAGVAEAARVAKSGAALFVFTFSRHTLPDGAEPVAGEPFVFTQFSGEPQCFLTDGQLLSELAAAGFGPDPAVPLTEYNRPPRGMVRTSGPPVIYEAAFRRDG